MNHTDTRVTSIAKTQQWLIESVIQYRFCPYAKQPHLENIIGYRTYTGNDIIILLEELAICCLELDGVTDNSVENTDSALGSKPALLETTLFIIASDAGDIDYLSDFHEYLDALDVANDFLMRPKKFAKHFSTQFKERYGNNIPKTWDNKYQLASFHPEYQFENSEADDRANHTNRSPYPILHIIRNATIENARLNDAMAAKIVENNITTLENMSEKSFRALQALGRLENS